MRFRPCIDLHNGKVKQIVGSSLRDDDPGALQTNFEADQPPAYYAALYRRDGLRGGHIIKLGPGCDEAAREALQAWPGNLQIGGGITPDNAAHWLDCGASHVIVTSCVFKNGQVDRATLAALVRLVGRDRLVLDLSCRRRGSDYFVVTDRWQKFTEVAITPQSLDEFSGSCAELLIHAADVEGKCGGIDEELVEQLGRWSSLPTTYAGGVRNMHDLERINVLGQGRLDVTVGSALDIFGGAGLRYDEVVAYTRAVRRDNDLS